MSSSPSYDVGQRITISVVFTNEQGDPVDPTAVIAKVKSPSGQVTKPSVTHDSLGHYSAEVDITEHSLWYFRFEGEGPNKAASEARFVGSSTAF